MHTAHRRRRGCRLAKSPAVPFRTPAVPMPGGRPDYPSAGAELAAKGPAMSADAAFAQDLRPVTNSITASPARPRARGSRP
eukprot:6707477-Prymnesium_polylepis.1